MAAHHKTVKRGCCIERTNGMHPARRAPVNFWRAASCLVRQKGCPQASKRERDNCDCRMMDMSVPIRSSAWSGTGTVIVESEIRFCMMM
jgi:hypothetical protein